MTTIENNRLIAEFRGKLLETGEYELPLDEETRLRYWDVELQYHTSYDWIMPVVEEIESMGYDVIIDGNTCIISRDESWFEDIEFYNKSKVLAIRAAVVKFINWFNKNK